MTALTDVFAPAAEQAIPKGRQNPRGEDTPAASLAHHRLRRPLNMSFAAQSSAVQAMRSMSFVTALLRRAAQVDGQVATDDNIIGLLVGQDIPGTVTRRACPSSPCHSATSTAIMFPLRARKHARAHSHACPFHQALALQSSTSGAQTNSRTHWCEHALRSRTTCASCLSYCELSCVCWLRTRYASVSV